MRALVPAAVLALGALAAPAAVRGQDNAVRFEILDVGDSTFSFAIGRHRWVKKGQQGIAVDPARRDVLVARFDVIQIDTAGVATGLVTGLTTRLKTMHVALLTPPIEPALRQRAFWKGAGTGALFGAVVGAVVTVLAQ